MKEVLLDTNFQFCCVVIVIAICVTIYKTFKRK